MPRWRGDHNYINVRLRFEFHSCSRPSLRVEKLNLGSKSDRHEHPVQKTAKISFFVKVFVSCRELFVHGTSSFRRYGRRLAMNPWCVWETPMMIIPPCTKPDASFSKVPNYLHFLYWRSVPPPLPLPPPSMPLSPPPMPRSASLPPSKPMSLLRNLYNRYEVQVEPLSDSMGYVDLFAFGLEPAQVLRRDVLVENLQVKTRAVTGAGVEAGAGSGGGAGASAGAGLGAGLGVGLGAGAGAGAGAATGASSLPPFALISIPCRFLYLPSR